MLKLVDTWSPPASILETALAILEGYVLERQHDDIDVDSKAAAADGPRYTIVGWHAMLQFGYLKLGDGVETVPLRAVPPPRRNLAESKRASKAATPSTFDSMTQLVGGVPETEADGENTKGFGKKWLCVEHAAAAAAALRRAVRDWERAANRNAAY